MVALVCGTKNNLCFSLYYIFDNNFNLLSLNKSAYNTYKLSKVANTLTYAKVYKKNVIVVSEGHCSVELRDLDTLLYYTGVLLVCANKKLNIIFTLNLAVLVIIGNFKLIITIINITLAI